MAYNRDTPALRRKKRKAEEAKRKAEEEKRRREEAQRRREAMRAREAAAARREAKPKKAEAPQSVPGGAQSLGEWWRQPEPRPARTKTPSWSRWQMGGVPTGVQRPGPARRTPQPAPQPWQAMYPSSQWGGVAEEVARRRARQTQAEQALIPTQPPTPRRPGKTAPSWVPPEALGAEPPAPQPWEIPLTGPAAYEPPTPSRPPGVYPLFKSTPTYEAFPATTHWYATRSAKRWGTPFKAEQAPVFSPTRQAELDAIAQQSGPQAAWDAMTPEEQRAAQNYIETQSLGTPTALGRGLGQLVDVLQAIPLAVEEKWGGVSQQIPAKYGFWALSPRKHLTSEQREAADKIKADLVARGVYSEGAVTEGIPGWFIDQGVLAASRLDKQSVHDYAIETYGDTPETEAALEKASLAGYSSYEAQVDTVDRLMAGEDIDTVLNGQQVRGYTDADGVYRFTPESQAAYDAYISWVQASGGDAQAAAEEVQRTGYIPPATDFGNEFLFQYALDPLNIPDYIGLGKVVAGKLGYQVATEATQLAAKTAAKAGDIYEIAEPAARQVDDVAQALIATAVKDLQPEDAAQTSIELARAYRMGDLDYLDVAAPELAAHSRAVASGVDVAKAVPAPVEPQFVETDAYGRIRVELADDHGALLDEVFDACDEAMFDKVYAGGDFDIDKYREALFDAAKRGDVQALDDLDAPKAARVVAGKLPEYAQATDVGTLRVADVGTGDWRLVDSATGKPVTSADLIRNGVDPSTATKLNLIDDAEQMAEAGFKNQYEVALYVKNNAERQWAATRFYSVLDEGDDAAVLASGVSSGDVGAWATNRLGSARTVDERLEITRQAAHYLDELEGAGKVEDEAIKATSRWTRLVFDDTVEIDTSTPLGRMIEQHRRQNPLRKVWEPTARAQLAKVSDDAGRVVANVAANSSSADEAMDTIRALVYNPEELVPYYGNWVYREDVQRARQVLAPVLDDVAQLPATQGATSINKSAFVNAFWRPIVTETAAQMGVVSKELPWYLKVVEYTKQWMNTAYLRWPGYAIRNAAGDTVTMAFDGKLYLGNVDDFLTRIGPTTPRVMGKPRGVLLLDDAALAMDDAAKSADEVAGILAREGYQRSVVPTRVGKRIDEAITSAYSAAEEARYKRAFVAGLAQGTAELWQPSLTDEMIQGTGLSAKEVAQAEKELRGAINATEIRKVCSDHGLPADDLARQWDMVRPAIVDFAEAGADFCLLDYVAGEKWFDGVLRIASPYHFWYTRSAVNWAKRAAKHPGMARAYIQYKVHEAQQNRLRGYPDKYAGAVEVKLPWFDDSLMWYPGRLLSPPEQIFGPIVDAITGKYYDEADNPIEALFNAYEATGLRWSPLIEYPLRALGVVGDKSEIPLLVTHLALIDGVTAMLGIGGPQGLNLSGGVRQIFHLRAEPYQGYHIDTRLAAMAADKPEDTEVTLRAQMLNGAVEDGKFTLSEAMGRRGDVEAITEFAKEQGWTQEQLEAAQKTLSTAVRLDTIESGIKKGLSAFLGVSTDVFPAGEKEQYGLQGEKRQAMYSPLTGLGSREGLQALQEAHPEMTPWGTRYGTLPQRPGEPEEEYTSAKALANLQYYRDLETLTTEYQRQEAELIREQPWNRDALQALRDEFYASSDALRAHYFPEEAAAEAALAPTPALLQKALGGPLPAPIGEPTGEVELWSVYGANDEEVQTRRNEQLMYVIGQGRPRVEDYTDEDGEIDWDAYYKATDDYFTMRVQNLRDDPTVIAIAEDLTNRTGKPVTPAQLLAAADQEAYEEHTRRNHTIPEAAVETWNETVYKPAWDQYMRAVENGMDKSRAYRKYIEPIGETTGRDLIKAIQELYPGRWSTHELLTELEGMTFPSVKETSFLRKPPEEQAVSAASEAFYDYRDTVLPPGERTSEWLYDIPSVRYVMDEANRDKLIAEDWEKALADAKAAFNEQDREDWGTPGNWAQAREENIEFDELVETAMPNLNYQALQDERRGLETDEARDLFDAQHPELQRYYEMRDEFAATHPIWERYYVTNESRFWDAIYGMPPGWRSNDVYDDPAVRAALDADEDNRALWGEAHEAVLAYIEQHQASWPGTPEEWTEARELNAQLAQAAADSIPGLQEILDGYYDLPKGAARGEYAAAHPEIQQYWDARDKFGAENPLWAKYYQTPQKISSVAWDFIHQNTPPGWRSSEIYDNELVRLLLGDRDVTTEQSDQIIAWVTEWIAGQDTSDWGTPEAWAEARRLNSELERILGELLPGIDTTMDMYYDTEPASELRRAFKQAHPEVQTHFDMRDAWGALPENAIWAYYYLRPGQYGKAAGSKGGGGGGDSWVWDEFYRQAHDVPRVYLETPSPWKGALRFDEYSYKSPFRLDWKQRLRWS